MAGGEQERHIRAWPRFWVVVLLLGSFPCNLSQPSILNLGTVFRRSINRGESHSYQLTLPAGTYGRLTVGRHEIDLALTVLNSDGRRLLTWNANRWTKNSLSLVADVSTVYQVLVSATEKGASSGAYEISLVERRPTILNDQTLLRAQSAFARGATQAAEGGSEALKESITYFQTAALLYHAGGDARGEAEALDSAARLLSRAGRYEEAQDALTRTLPIWERLNEELARLETLHTLTTVQGHLGQKTKELPALLRALQLWKIRGDRQGEAVALGRIGGHELWTGNTAGALKAFQENLRLRQALGDRQGEADVLADIGTAYEGARQYQKAVYWHLRKLQLCRDLQDPRCEAAALSHAATSLRMAGHPRESVGYYQLARKLHHSAGDVSGEAGILFELAEAERLTGHLLDALALCREALAMEESLRSSITDPKSRAGFHGQRYYERGLIDILWDLHRQDPAAGYDQEAFLTADRARHRFISDALPSNKPDGVQGLRRSVLDDNTVLLEYWLEDRQSFLFLLTRTRFRIVLLPGRDIVESMARDLYSFLIARNQRLPGETIGQRSARISRADAQYRLAAASLSRTLLAPVAEELNGKRVLVVADGLLQYVPFSALADPSRGDNALMMAHHEIVNLPSATILSARRKAFSRRRRPPLQLAILADPVFAKDDPRVSQGYQVIASPSSERMPTSAARMDPPVTRLPFSRREAFEVMKLSQGPTTLALLDFDATRQAILSGRLRDYRIWHIAAHGLQNENPDLSGIALSMVDRKGRAIEGFLQLRDLYKLTIPADLVVLSACQTALGRDILGDGVFGLTGGFLRAGATRVLSTLWKVDDEPTAEFMVAFYREVFQKGLAPGAALRAAQIGMRRQERWQSPYFWGGFVLQGEWR